MNLVEAELRRESDGLRVSFGPHCIRVDRALVEARPRLFDYDGHHVVLGIRPQKMADAALMDEADIECTIAATVELREDLGSEVDVHVAIDAPVPSLEAVIEATEAREAGVTGRPQSSFIARLGADTEARVGGQVKLWLDPRALHFFRSRQRGGDPVTDRIEATALPGHARRGSSTRRRDRSNFLSPGMPCPTLSSGISLARSPSVREAMWSNAVF